MSAVAYETRAYDNEHGNPVVVLVATGTHDVSRLMLLLSNGNCEQVSLSQTVLRQVRRHNGGRAALSLLKAHGGPDFTEGAAAMTPNGDGYQRAIAVLTGVVARSGSPAARWAVEYLTADPDRWRQAQRCWHGDECGGSGPDCAPDPSAGGQ